MVQQEVIEPIGDPEVAEEQPQGFRDYLEVVDFNWRFTRGSLRGFGRGLLREVDYEREER